MEEAKVFRKAHGSSCYHGSAIVACFDALAFTSACTMISSARSSPDENLKPPQAYPMKSKGRDLLARQGTMEERALNLGHVCKEYQDATRLTKSVKLHVPKDQDAAGKATPQQLAVYEDDEFNLLPQQGQLKGQIMPMQKDPDAIFMPLPAPQAKKDQETTIYAKRPSTITTPTNINATRPSPITTPSPPVIRPSPNTTPPKSSKPSPSLLPLHYQSPAPCSVCSKLLQVGWPTRSLSYAEVKKATQNFSRSSFLSEGESSFVYKGTLSDGKQVAIKSVGHKTVKFQSEVRTLGSLQHPNIVSLIGFCDEDGKAILVYDYICNGTLDWHLSARNPNIAPWHARQNIAIHVARGLQFLHECQLGCLLHRDIRAKNVLLTHDYTPVIAGFGNARWAELVEEEERKKPLLARGSFAREDVVSEKADVYAFGVLLLELITGHTVTECPQSHSNQQSLVEWARPLLLEDSEVVINQILDPRLGLHYKPYELFCMVNAASMCLRNDPATRPRMRLIVSCLEDGKERPQKTPVLMKFIQQRPSNTAHHHTSSGINQANHACIASTGCHASSTDNSIGPSTGSCKRKEDKRKSLRKVTWKLPETQCMAAATTIKPRIQNLHRSKTKLLSYNDLL